MTQTKQRKPPVPHSQTTPRRQCKNPGATRFNQVYSKRNPRSLEQASDEELLTIVLGSSVAAQSVISEIGTLENYTKLGEGQRLLDHPGISKGTAVKLDALYEISVRVG